MDTTGYHCHLNQSKDTMAETQNPVRLAQRKKNSLFIVLFFEKGAFLDPYTKPMSY